MMTVMSGRERLWLLHAFHVVVLLLPLLELIGAAAIAEDGPLVSAPVGSIRGKVETFEGVQVDEFLGIPYAKPPVGDLRFALPVPFGNVEGEFNATNFGARCLQPPMKAFISPGAVSEDCLHLNVFRKTGTTGDDKKPVVVMVHGGGFSVGAASDLFYYSPPLVVFGDVIVVSMNYRLGLLGFADMKQLAPGNLGLFDQRLALEWIQDNIRAFGGDPDRVTLMGVSAGSISVNAQISSPLNRDGRKRFHAVIMDAGVLSAGFVLVPDLVFAKVKKIAATAGCTTDGPEMVACLRQIDAKKLLELSYDAEDQNTWFSFKPTTDGKFIAADIAKDVRDNANEFLKVKTMLGAAKDEGSMFVWESFDFTFDDFPTLDTEDKFVAWCAKLAKRYDHPIDMNDENVRKSVAATYYKKNPSRMLDASTFVGDGTFICPTKAFAKSYAKVNNAVYVYKFERKLRRNYTVFDPNVLGAFHSSGFTHMSGCFFGLVGLVPGLDKIDDEDRAYFLDSIRMVADFAKSDEPPQFRGVRWPNFAKGEGVMVFDEAARIEKTLYGEGRCEKVFGVFEPTV